MNLKNMLMNYKNVIYVTFFLFFLFYNLIMKIYIDYIFFINFLFNFIILFGTSSLLKINVKIFRLIFSALISSCSIFLLFIPLNNYVFFFLKIMFGLLTVILAFNYKSIKYTLNNFLYLMVLSILVGGLLYFLNIQVGYEHLGMIFYTNGKSLNIFIMILISILFILLYIKKTHKNKNTINYFYKITLYDKEKIKLNGYLDSGNTLFDPYFNKPILILNNNKKLHSNKFIFVPFKTLNSEGIIKCYFIEKIYISDIGYKYNVLIGISPNEITIDGVDIILNKEILL